MEPVIGLRELNKKLDNLEKKTAKKVIKTALRKGSKVIRDEAKKNAVSMVGGQMGNMLKKNIITRAFKRPKRGFYGLFTGMRADVPEFAEVSKDGRRNYIPAAIEYGHAAPGAGGKKSIKTVPAIPFMRKAADTKGGQAKQVAVNEIRKGIIAAAKR